MRIIYLLLIIFIAGTALFFYWTSNFNEIGNLTETGGVAARVKEDTKSQPVNISSTTTTNIKSTTTKSPAPPGFIGPTGQPSIIGPQGQPPNY
ncbi:MAG: hypothetical protein AAB536_00340 [Patescibacteria group bacterium]